MGENINKNIHECVNGLHQKKSKRPMIRQNGTSISRKAEKPNGLALTDRHWYTLIVVVWLDFTYKNLQL